MVPPILSLMLIIAAAQPQVLPQGITSAYTKLDLDHCDRADNDEAQSPTWRCTGFGGVPLIVQSGDDRYDIDAGLEDADEFWAESFDYPGATVEWRLQRGIPFAVIYRLVSSGDGRPRSSRLIVETIGRELPGCRVASIGGGLKHANELARQAADRIATGGATCMRADE
ncbi:MAG: hypothetical protein ACR2JJ_11975 [Sphingomicrobium sp.]